MIKDLLKLLSLSEHYGVSESIEIAKGKYAIPKSFKHAYEQGKRKANGN
tara:strand:- start:171 stop:317 length:147 start_codon:yes stop_codon:yes gene_type:complete